MQREIYFIGIQDTYRQFYNNLYIHFTQPIRLDSLVTYFSYYIFINGNKWASLSVLDFFLLNSIIVM